MIRNIKATGLFGRNARIVLAMGMLAALLQLPAATRAEDEAMEADYDVDAEGGELIEPCDEGTSDRKECKPSEVQERGTMVPSIPFKLKSERYDRCLRPTSNSNGAEVRLYSCGNYSSRYWEPVSARRGSGIKGEWNADWEYQLKNKWTGYCLKVRKPSTSSNGVLIQADCSNAGFVNFVPSPNSPIGGEFHIIRGQDGPNRGSDRQFCIRAISSTSPVVQSSSNTTFQCANWSSLRWHRAPW